MSPPPQPLPQADEWYKTSYKEKNYKDSAFISGFGLSQEQFVAFQNDVKTAVDKHLDIDAVFRGATHKDQIAKVEADIRPCLEKYEQAGLVFRQQLAWSNEYLRRMVLRQHNSRKRAATNLSPSKPSAPPSAPSSRPSAPPTKISAKSKNKPPSSSSQSLLVTPIPVVTLDTVQPRPEAKVHDWADLEIQIFWEDDTEPTFVDMLDQFVIQGGSSGLSERASTSYDYNLFIAAIVENFTYSADQHKITYERPSAGSHYLVKNAGFWRAALTFQRIEQHLRVLCFKVWNKSTPTEVTSLTSQSMPASPVKRAHYTTDELALGISPRKKSKSKALEAEGETDINDDPIIIRRRHEPARHRQLERQRPIRSSSHNDSSMDVDTEFARGALLIPSRPGSRHSPLVPFPTYYTPKVQADPPLSFAQLMGRDTSRPPPRSTGFSNPFAPEPLRVSNAHGVSAKPSLLDRPNSALSHHPLEPIQSPLTSEPQTTLSSTQTPIASRSSPVKSPARQETPPPANTLGIEESDDPGRELSQEEIESLTERLKEFGAIAHEDPERWRNMCRFFKHTSETDFKTTNLINLRGMSVGLKPHQAYAIYWAMTRPWERGTDLDGGIIADEMGLGKTIEAIGLVIARAWLVFARNEIRKDRKMQREQPGRHTPRHLPRGSTEKPQGPGVRCPTDPFGIQCPCVEGTMANLAAFSSRLPEGPTLIVAPPTLCINWYDEFNKFVITGPNELGMQVFLQYTNKDDRCLNAANILSLKCMTETPDNADIRPTYSSQHPRMVVITSAGCLHNQVCKPTTMAVSPNYTGLMSNDRTFPGVAWGILFRDEYHKDKGTETMVSQFFTEGYTSKSNQVKFSHPGYPWKWALSGTPFDTTPLDLKAHLQALEYESWTTDPNSVMVESKPEKLDLLEQRWKSLTNVRAVNYQAPTVQELRDYSDLFSGFLHPWVIRRMGNDRFFGEPIISLPPFIKETRQVTTDLEFLAAMKDLVTGAQKEWDAKVAEWNVRHKDWIANGRRGREPVRPNERGRNSGKYYYLRLAANFPNLPTILKDHPTLTFKSVEVNAVSAKLPEIPSASPYSRYLDDITKGSKKLAELRILINEMMRNNVTRSEKMVVFTYNPATALIIHQWLSKNVSNCRPTIITSNHASGARQEILDSFCEKKGSSPDKRHKRAAVARVLVSTMALIGTGFTINRATWATIFDHDWVQREHNQAEKRIHRIGQTSRVKVFQLLNIDNPAEMAIANIHASRGKVTDMAYKVTNEQMRARERGDGKGKGKEKQIKEKRVQNPVSSGFYSDDVA